MAMSLKFVGILIAPAEGLSADHSLTTNLADRLALQSSSSDSAACRILNSCNVMRLSELVPQALHLILPTRFLRG